MSTLAPERPTVTPDQAEAIVNGWLTSADPVAGLEHPAGPLFADGYTEFEITMTGGGGGWTGDCCLCSGSWDPQWGWIQCC